MFKRLPMYWCGKINGVIIADYTQSLCVRTSWYAISICTQVCRHFARAIFGFGIHPVQSDNPEL